MPETPLETALDYLQKEVAPNAQEIDRNPAALRKALQGLCDRNLMSLKCPATYGGPGISEENFRRIQEECAAASGALAFLQTQHQSAVGPLANSDNDALKDQ